MTLMPSLRSLAQALRRSVVGNLLVALFFLGCTVLMFKNGLFEGKIFWQADTIMFYYPISARIDQLLELGRLPVWTPYIFGGHPLLADGEAGMFYPIHLLIWWLTNAQDGFVAMRVIRFWLAGVCMYGFLRTLSINRSGAVIGGLVYAFGSFVVGQLQHANVGTYIAWTPLLLRYVELSLQSVGRRRLLSVILAGAVIGIQILTIHINAMLMTGLITGAYVIFRCLAGPVGGDVSQATAHMQEGIANTRQRITALLAPVARRCRLGATILGGAGLLGLGLGAVQFLPLLELAQFSPRYEGVDYRFATSFALPPANLLTLLFPYFFRDAQNGYWSPWFRWDSTVYVGIATLILALLAIVRVRSRYTLFFTLLAGAGLLLAMGDYLPIKLYAVLWKLPIFSMTRVPSRFTFFTVVGLAALAAQGATWLEQKLRQQAAGVPRNSRRGKSVLAAVALALLVAGSLWWGLQQTSTWVTAHPNEALSLLNRWYPRDRLNPLIDTPSQNALDGLRYSLQASNVWTRNTMLWLALSAGVLAGWYRLRRLRLFWQAALVALVAADLLLFARDFHPRVARQDLAPRSAVVDFLRANNGVHRVYVAWPVTLLGANRLLPYAVAEAGGYSSLVTKRYNDYVGAMQQEPGRFLDMMNVRYVIVSPQSGYSHLAGASKVFEEGSYAVYERPSVLPRAYLVHQARLASSPKSALRIMSEASFDPCTMVVLERSTAGSDQTAGAAVDTDTATVLSYGSDDVSVQTVTAQESYLVLSDTYYPGWQAEIDGKSAPLMQANYLFRAVRVPAGNHVVRFAFRPAVVAIGGLISLFSGVAIVLAAGLASLRLFVNHTQE